MLETIKTAATWLSVNVDPSVPRALFVVAVLLTVLVIRKTLPRVWEAFARVVPVPVIDPHPLLLLVSKAWQALPGTLIGAGLAALGAGGDIRSELKGAAFGAVAALAHEVLKAVPWVPYVGAVGKTKLPPLPVLYLLGLVGFCVVQPVIVGCGAFRNITPADRAEAYAAHAKTTELACKAYRFDLATGLTPDVPAMAMLCAGAGK